MMGYVVLGLLAAFGGYCVLWALFGFLLPGNCRCTMVVLCSPTDESALLRRLLWLRETGLLRCGLLLSGRGLNSRQRQRLRQKFPSIEFCDPEEPGK
ncbi:MAG: hypothetical protein E7438_04125 [Ruminococcaceae bacterium]|nr:hypothetical protein [Oscillospiraceae bacterium]